MELKRKTWNKKDKDQFLKYLNTLQNKDRIIWTKKILNTKLECLSIKTDVIKKIATEIYKGNYCDFLNLKIYDYYDSYAVNGFIINKIKDFNSCKHYLDIYSIYVDNWGLCDLINIDIKNNEEKFLNLIKEYVKDPLPFKRRIGLRILFKYIKYDCYLNDCFSIIDSLKDEKEYYVNMIIAWLLCELFIKRRNETLKYLNKCNLNSWTINKMISKCIDSYRVNKEDKEMLLKYKKK